MPHFDVKQFGIVGWTVLAFVCAFGLSVPLVLLGIRVCRRQGWVSRPRIDRWHKNTPAFFGGVPIYLAFLALSVVFVPWSNHLLWRLIGIASLMFVLGLIDDMRRLAPLHKLLCQVAAAALLVFSGVIYPLRGSIALNILVSVVWLVGITNAFNLLDNMDGLSAGVALISAAYLSLFYVAGGHRDQAMFVALVAGTIAGFLVFNFNPARIFMGDCGSLFIGFLLASSSLLEVTHVSGLPTLVLSPVIVLAIPIFDTLFVSVTRRLRGQAISQGGTDHSSHRLVRLGLHEKRAVLLLYALSAGSGAVALIARHSSSAAAPGLIGFWFLFLLLFGIHLFDDDLLHPLNRRTPVLKRLLSRDALIFILDPLAMLLSYYLAYALRFGGRIPDGDRLLLLRSVPIVLGIKLIALWACRAFRHSWWRGSVSDIYRLGAALIVAEGLSVLALTAIYRFEGFSRAVFAADALITWLLLLAIRRSSFLFRETMCSWSASSSTRRRVFILGTSSRAELALRFLREQQIECAGFIDTNGGTDLRRYVFGRPVLGRFDDLGRLSVEYDVSEVVLLDRDEILLPEVDFQAVCQNHSLRLTRLGLYEHVPQDQVMKAVVNA
jgi:UDP-GlcNAc:undecaprenyl-phosphate GlcNAc-1-phosphate transferase